MNKHSPSLMAEELEELSGMLSVMTQVAGADADCEIYRTLRAAWKKAAKIEKWFSEMETAKNA